MRPQVPGVEAVPSSRWGDRLLELRRDLRARREVLSPMRREAGRLRDLRRGLGDGRPVLPRLRHGHGRGTAPGRVAIKPDEGERQEIEASHIVIATGSVPVRPKSIPFDGEHIIDSDEILRLKKIPRHMIVVEGADWSNDWSVFSKPFDANLVYQFHYYCWDNPTTLKGIDTYLNYRKQFNAPVWVGETGERLVEFLERLVLG